MAIVIEEKNRGGGVGRLITILFVVIALCFVAYYLFFAPTPVFDYIAPASLREATQLSTFNVDPEKVLSSPEFRSLQRYDNLPPSGSFGRQNPFSPSF